MKALMQKRVSIAWVLLVAIGCAAAVIVWKVAIADAPPGGSAFIVGGQAQQESATITPFPTTTPRRVIAGPGTGQAIATATESAAVAGDPAQSDGSAPEATSTVPTIAVYVSGDVAKPGVYYIPEGSRIVTAVDAAGGANPDADLEQINLAQKVSDGDHITIYHKGEVAPAATTSNPSASAGAGESATAAPTTPGALTPVPTQTRGAAARPTSGSSGAAKAPPAGKINLNTATAADLELLPGIGPSLAQRIIADRQQNGPFKSVDDLARISGSRQGSLQGYGTM
jgi:competence protein ComEA